MRRRTSALPQVFLTVAVVAGWPWAPVAADEIREQLELALELYDAGDYGGAVSELQFAIGEIQAKLAGSYAQSLPPPPAGWTAEPASQGASPAFFGGGSIITREYRETGGRGTMTATLMMDSPMLQGMAALLGNPAMLAGNPNMKRIRLGRDNALLDFDAAAGRGEVTYMLGGRALLKVEGGGLASADPLVDLLKAWDVDGLKDAAGL